MRNGGIIFVVSLGERAHSLMSSECEGEGKTEGVIKKGASNVWKPDTINCHVENICLCQNLCEIVF